MRRILILGTTLLLGGATAATAYHPGPRDMVRVRALAHDLERVTAGVHRVAERQRHHFDRREESAFRALHRLADESRHFHRQSERFLQNPAHTERDFRDVVRAYGEAVRHLDDLHGTLVVARDFQRIGYLVVQLDRYYGHLDHGRWNRYRGRHGYWPGRQGRFDRHDRRHRAHGQGARGHDGRGRGHYEGRGRGHREHADAGRGGDRHRSYRERYERDRAGHEYDRRDDRQRDEGRGGAWRTRPD